MQRLGVGYDLNFGLVGFEAGTSVPYWRYDPFTRGPSSVMAIPTIAMDDLLLNPTCYALRPAEARELLRGLGRAVALPGGSPQSRSSRSRWPRSTHVIGTRRSCVTSRMPGWS
jgi:hypothetical protein